MSAQNGFLTNRTAGGPTGAFFGHSGFNSGYLTVMFGSKAGGRGMVIMANAPEDMSGNVPNGAS